MVPYLLRASLIVPTPNHFWGNVPLTIWWSFNIPKPFLKVRHRWFRHPSLGKSHDNMIDKFYEFNFMNLTFSLSFFFNLALWKNRSTKFYLYQWQVEWALLHQHPSYEIFYPRQLSDGKLEPTHVKMPLFVKLSQNHPLSSRYRRRRRQCRRQWR